MELRTLRWMGWLAAVWVGVGAAQAQRRTEERRVPVGELSAADTSGALVEMAAQAGLIFAGHVVSITRNDAAGYVDVRFGIDEAVSGCPAAGEYGVREWAGLWAGRAARYQVGQRYLMILRLPGAGGFSTPVGGMDGAIPLVAAGAGPVMAADGTVAADTGAGALSGLAADLRWVQARAVRGKGVGGLQAVSAVDSTAVGQPVVAPVASIGDGTRVTLESVLAVLRGVGSGAR